MRQTSVRVLTGIAFAGLLSSQTIAGQGVLPSSATYRGLTSSEWSALWWQAVFAIPVEGGNHPLISGGAFGGNNHLVFLAAPTVPPGSPKVTIPVTIAAGTRVFVPIISAECSVAEPAPFHGKNRTELRACANNNLEQVGVLYAAIDGKPIKNPAAYRAESPLFQYGPLTARNVLNVPPGTQSDSVAAGYFLLLPPFSAGVHRIVVRAKIPAAELVVDAEFVLQVLPPQEG